MPTARAHWLVKSEPDAFSWDQQVANRVEPWTGVRNAMAQQQPEGHEARRPGVLLPLQRRQGDRRRGPRGARGLSRPDAPRSGDWVCVDMEAVGADADARLHWQRSRPRRRSLIFALVRMSRLSVMPVSPEHWKLLCRMGGWKS